MKSNISESKQKQSKSFFSYIYGLTGTVMIGIIIIILLFGAFAFISEMLFSTKTNQFIPAYEIPACDTVIPQITEVTNFYYNQSYYNYTTQRCDNVIQFAYRHDVKCSRKAYKAEVHGQSMHPFVSDGYIWLDPSVEWDDIRVGDIVRFDVNGTKIIHALTYKNSHYALSAGYNNDYVDAWYVHPHMITARYCVK